MLNINVNKSQVGGLVFQGNDIETGRDISPESFSYVYVLTGTNEIALIDRRILENGNGFQFLIEEPGVTLRHDFDKTTIPVAERPSNYNFLVKLKISILGDYTTKRIDEPFTFVLVFRSGDYEFHDWQRSGETGSTEPDSYVAQKSKQLGVTVNENSKVVGFADGELTGKRIYGNASFSPNLEGNELSSNVNPGNTAVITGVGEVSFGTGIEVSPGVFLGIHKDTKRPYYVVNAVGIGYHNDAPYWEHEEGLIIVNDTPDQFLLGLDTVES